MPIATRIAAANAAGFHGAGRCVRASTRATKARSSPPGARASSRRSPSIARSSRSMDRSQPFVKAVAQHVPRPLQALAHDDFARAQTRRDVGAGAPILVEEGAVLDHVGPELLAAETQRRQRVAAALVGGAIPFP